MDGKILLYIGLGLLAYLVIRIVTRLMNRPNRQFWRDYREILTSSKYKVKGHFED